MKEVCSRKVHSQSLNAGKKTEKPGSAQRSAVFACFLFLFSGVTPASGQRFEDDDFLLRESVSAADPRTARRIFDGFQSQARFATYGIL